MSSCSAPRKPKQLHRSKDERASHTAAHNSRVAELYSNYDLFNNEESSSFLSSSSQSFYYYNSSSNNKADDEHHYKHRPSSTLSSSTLDLSSTNEDDEDIQLHPDSRTSVKFAPVIYFFASFITLFGGVLSTLHTDAPSATSALKNKSFDVEIFPQFRDLPFRQIPIFQLGIAFTSLIGIVNYCVSYFVWKESKYSTQYLKTQLSNCFIGIASQIAILLFAILPFSSPHLHSKSLRAHDYIVLNVYFALSFIYQAVYMFCLMKSVPNIVKKSHPFSIRVALFSLSTIVNVLYLASLIMKEGWIMGKEQLLNSNSVCGYMLFCLNTVFISSFYFDLKSVNLILRFAQIEEVKSIRRAHKNIL